MPPTGMLNVLMPPVTMTWATPDDGVSAAVTPSAITDPAGQVSPGNRRRNETTRDKGHQLKKD